MDPFTIASGIAAIGSAASGWNEGRKADKANKKALEFAEQQYQQLAPMRRQGMQALGQIEAPINLGHIGFNSANPFAAARGPAPSTASLGDWGRFTTSPDDIDMALSGVRPDELQFMEDATNAQYIGKSGGKQRYLGKSGRQYTNDDRNHAFMLNTRFGNNLGYSGTTPDELMRRRGIQPLGGR